MEWTSDANYSLIKSNSVRLIVNDVLPGIIPHLPSKDIIATSNTNAKIEINKNEKIYKYNVVSNNITENKLQIEGLENTESGSAYYVYLIGTDNNSSDVTVTIGNKTYTLKENTKLAIRILNGVIIEYE